VPIFLKQAYEFYLLEVLGRESLAIVDRGNEEVAPATIRKHIEHLLAAGSSGVVQTAGTFGGELQSAYSSGAGRVPPRYFTSAT
jgi:hypothetical protein